MKLKIRQESLQVIRLSMFAVIAGFTGIFAAHISILFSVKGMQAIYIGFLMGVLNFSGVIGPLIITSLLQKKENYRGTIFLISLGLFLGVLMLGVFNEIWLIFMISFFFGLIMNSLSPVQEVTYVNTLYNPYREYGIVRTVSSLGYVSIALSIAIFPIVNISSVTSIVIFGMVGFSLIAIAGLVLIPKSKEISSIGGGGNKNKISFFQTIRQINPKIFIIFLLIFFNYVGLRAIEIYIGLQAIEIFNFKSITLLFVISGGAEIVTIYFGQRIVGHIGYILSFAIILAGTVVRLLGLGFIEGAWVLYATQVLHFASFGLLLSSLIHFVNHIVLQKNRPVVMGMYQAMVSISSILSSVIGGVLVSKYGYSNMFAIMAIFPIIGLICLLIFIPKLKFSEVIPHTH